MCKEGLVFLFKEHVWKKYNNVDLSIYIYKKLEYQVKQMSIFRLDRKLMLAWLVVFFYFLNDVEKLNTIKKEN